MSTCGLNTRRQIYKEFQGKCAYCGCVVRMSELTIDHVIPKCIGGKLNRRNIRPACRFCNSLKSCLSEKEFKKKILEEHSKKGKNKVKNKYEIEDGKVVFFYEKMEKQKESLLEKLYSLGNGESL